MTSDSVLEAISLSCLAASLAIFFLQAVPRRPKRPMGPADFGIVFSAFLAGWMATEVLEAVTPSDWYPGVQVLHFAVLASFAAWMNVRWRWALRRARAGS